MIQVRDKYDEAVEFFKTNPNLIPCAWRGVGLYKYGFLFSWLNEVRTACGSLSCGCPSMVKGSSYFHADGPNASIIEEKIAELDIPNFDEMDIEPNRVTQRIIDSLPLFAEVQRLADTLIPNRVLP